MCRVARGDVSRKDGTLQVEMRSGNLRFISQSRYIAIRQFDYMEDGSLRTLRAAFERDSVKLLSDNGARKTSNSVLLKMCKGCTHISKTFDRL